VSGPTIVGNTCLSARLGQIFHWTAGANIHSYEITQACLSVQQPTCNLARQKQVDPPDSPFVAYGGVVTIHTVDHPFGPSSSMQVSETTKTDCPTATQPVADCASAVAAGLCFRLP
jgi:hypothetical protein